MRHTIRAITFLLGAGLAVSCLPTDGISTTGPRHRGSVKSLCDEAMADTKDAAQAMQDCAYARNDGFPDKGKNGSAERVELQREPDRLAGKVARSSGAAKVSAQAKREAVRGEWNQVKKKRVDQAESTAELSWDDVMGGFQKSYGDLKDSLAMTRQWLSDKLAP